MPCWPDKLSTITWAWAWPDRCMETATLRSKVVWADHVPQWLCGMATVRMGPFDEPLRAKAVRAEAKLLRPFLQAREPRFLVVSMALG